MLKRSRDSHQYSPDRGWIFIFCKRPQETLGFKIRAAKLGAFVLPGHPVQTCRLYVKKLSAPTTRIYIWRKKNNKRRFKRSLDVDRYAPLSALIIFFKPDSKLAGGTCCHNCSHKQQKSSTSQKICLTSRRDTKRGHCPDTIRIFPLIPDERLFLSLYQLVELTLM